MTDYTKVKLWYIIFEGLVLGKGQALLFWCHWLFGY